MAISEYPNPPTSKVGVTTPAHLYEATPDGIFSVVLYDQAMQGAGAPYPRPSMMNIVPRSRWSSEYLFQVPTNIVEILQGYYVNVICRKVDYDHDSIQISVNGGKFASIRASGISLKKMWGAGTIPDAPDLMGVTFAVGPGSWRIKNIAKGDSNTVRPGFIVYNYGDRGVNPNGSLGSGTAYDQFFSYSSPAGMVFKQYGTAKPTMTATVQAKCGKWDICVNDVGGVLNGIRYIELLNYTDNNYVFNPPVARNVMIDRQFDSLGKGEIILSGADKQYCFSVSTISQADSAQASIAIYDNSGERIVLSLSAKARVVGSSSGLVSTVHNDSLIFNPTALGTTNCSKITYTNVSDSDFIITSIDIPSNTSNFNLTSNLPVLPLTLHAKDSISFTFCFTPTTINLTSTLFTFHTDCGAPVVNHLIGYGASGLLYASDITFYGVDSGQTVCEPVILKNIGLLPLVLEKDPIISDTLHFTISSNFLSNLPITLQPGVEITVNVCYKANNNYSDTAFIQWKTNIPSSLDGQMKTISKLIGTSGGLDVGIVTIHSAISEKLEAYTIGTQLHLIVPNDMPALYECDLYDLLGRKVMSWDNTSTQVRPQEMLLPLPRLGSGMYIVRLKYGTKQLSGKVLIGN